MEYSGRIEQYKESMIKTLQELIAIPSVEGPETPDMPFGQGVHQALLYMLQKAEDTGFITCNVDNYAGHIEFGGFVLDEDGEVLETSDEVIGILGHLDVVPEGNHWDFPPFGGEISQGRIYGRGAIDDKGPVVAAFYAMKALKDSGFVPRKKVRLILGLDEETQWRSLTRYFQKEKAPSMGFTPDAQFPAISGEMGILIFDLAKKISKSTTKGLTLKSFKGGNAPNMVADFARVVVSDEHSGTYEKIRDMVAEFRGNTQSQIYVKGVGKSLEITAKGVSAHGARPGQGINAISILMSFLGRLSFANEDVNEFVAFYNRHIGFELDGTGLGCGLWDEPSGKLILNVGLVEMDGEAARLVINIRYPITLGESDVYDALLPIMNQYNLGIVKRKHQSPIRFEEGDPMIDALMEVYRKHTGDQRAPMVIGGGTYARATENIVAFGPSLPEDPEVAHQKNEYIEIDRLMLAAKIYADAIYRLAQI